MNREHNGKADMSTGYEKHETKIADELQLPVPKKTTLPYLQSAKKTKKLHKRRATENKRRAQHPM